MASKTVTVEFKGGKALERHLKNIAMELGSGGVVKVGFFEDAIYSGGKRNYTAKRRAKMSQKGKDMAEFLQGKDKYTGPVAQVAVWNEFGTKKTPPRPFMRSTVAKKSPRWGNGLAVALKKTGYNSGEALSILGSVIVGQIQQTIDEWKDPPNAQLTVDLKGFNKPLLDSGRMRAAVAFEVDDGIDKLES